MARCQRISRVQPATCLEPSGAATVLQASAMGEVRMLRLLTLCAGLALVSPVAATSDGAVDARMNAYFETWADNASVTQAKVAQFYAERVDYYGHVMSRAGVLQAKLAIVRQWPIRRYRVVPGSVVRACAARFCTIDVVLNWEVANTAGRSGSVGATTVSLRLVMQDGAYKIAAESGVPLARTR